MSYGIKGLYLQSSQLFRDASMFIKANICRLDIVFSGKILTYNDICRKPEL